MSTAKTTTGILALIVVIIVTIVLSASLYIVGEAEQVVVLQFGKPVGDPVVDPGIHLKTPFLQEIRRFDKRILAWDGDPNQIPTKGREFISIDTTARWRIVDALRFLERVQDETGAQTRLDDIIDSVVRDKISSTDLTEIVRSKDWEVTEEDLRQVNLTALAAGDAALTADIKVGRNTLTRAILEEASSGLPENYGIELVDVRIKRLNYIPSVRVQVFQRMVSERQRIAEQFRSEGKGEASRIRGDTARQLADIRSEASRKAEVIRGEADAQATRIYNEAYSQDADFYTFFRTLESYPKTLKSQTTLLIGSESEYFRFLKTPFMDMGTRRDP